MAIQYKLLQKEKLNGLQHTTKIHLLVQWFRSPSVLQYDRECSKLPATNNSAQKQKVAK